IPQTSRHARQRAQMRWIVAAGAQQQEDKVGGSIIIRTEGVSGIKTREGADRAPEVANCRVRDRDTATEPEGGCLRAIQNLPAHGFVIEISFRRHNARECLNSMPGVASA